MVDSCLQIGRGERQVDGDREMCVTAEEQCAFLLCLSAALQACAGSVSSLVQSRGERAREHRKDNIRRTYEDLFERLDKAKCEGLWEGRVEVKLRDQNSQKGKMLARESAARRGCQSEEEEGGLTKRSINREEKRDRKLRSILRSGGDWQVSALEMLLSVTCPHDTAATRWL